MILHEKRYRIVFGRIHAWIKGNWKFLRKVNCKGKCKYGEKGKDRIRKGKKGRKKIKKEGKKSEKSVKITIETR